MEEFFDANVVVLFPSIVAFVVLWIMAVFLVIKQMCSVVEISASILSELNEQFLKKLFIKEFFFIKKITFSVKRR